MAFWNKKDEENAQAAAGAAAAKVSELPSSSAFSVTPVVGSQTDTDLTWKVSRPKVEWSGAEGVSQDGEAVVTERFGGKVRSVLGAGTVIQGKLSFDTPVRIDGKLSGEVLSSKAVIIGASGEMSADIDVGSLVVLGRVKGTIKASEKIEVFAGGSLEGEISAPALVIHGGTFNGKCIMPHLSTSSSSAAKGNLSGGSATKETASKEAGSKETGSTSGIKSSSKAASNQAAEGAGVSATTTSPSVP